MPRSSRPASPRSARSASAEGPVLHPDLSGPLGERVLVRRSARRRRSVSITRRDGDLEVAIPATFSRAQERQWAQKMVEQMTRRHHREAAPARSDAELAALAIELSDRYLGGRARPRSVQWSARQNLRWGSCTSAEGSIRLSTRLQGMPRWVVESVMVHELVHLLVPDHGPDFQELMARYPRAERAKGFLEGVAWARDMPDPAEPEGPADSGDQPSV